MGISCVRLYTKMKYVNHTKYIYLFKIWKYPTFKIWAHFKNLFHRNCKREKDIRQNSICWIVESLVYDPSCYNFTELKTYKSYFIYCHTRLNESPNTQFSAFIIWFHKSWRLTGGTVSGVVRNVFLFYRVCIKYVLEMCCFFFK